jgi:peptide/nickel transport system substrate-binding protein
MTARKSAGRRVGAMVAAVALLAAACGGSSKKGSSSGSAKDTGTPKPGGHLVMGTEAEVDGFLATANRWDVTGLEYASTVFDPLTTYGKDNKVHPYLAQSLDHNADYTLWTIKLRPGIKFSNGDPLTADDVVADLQAHQKSPLTGPVVFNIDTVSKVDDLTLTVKCKTAWVPFPVYLAGQVGMVFSPKMLTDPKGSQHPIGTGPFTLKEWVPGNHFIATKNPNYWQKGLPYLDSIEYKPIVEVQSRENSVLSGTIDLMHSSDPQSLLDLKGKSGVNSIDDSKVAGEEEESFVMLNTGKAPLDDIRVRQALAYATDRKKYNDTVNFGIPPLADGPFGNTGSHFHGSTGYPTYNLQKAKDLVKSYEQGKGVNSISFELGTVNAGRDLQAISLLQDMWREAGITVNLKQVEQSQFILNALQGQYQGYLWRQFGEPDPDGDVVWWSTATAAPEGQLALNFSRNKDPQIDADLLKGRTDPNDAHRVAAYQDIAKRFAVDDPFIFLNQAVWQVAYKTSVHGITTWTLPDGSAGIDHTLGGLFLMSHVWVG